MINQGLRHNSRVAAVSRACSILMLFFPFYIYLLDLRGAPRWCSIALLTVGLVVHLGGISGTWLWVRALSLLLPAAALLAVQSENLVRIYPFVISLHYWLMFLHKRGDGRSALEVHASRFKTLAPWEGPMLRSAARIWQVGLAFNTLALFVLMFTFSSRIWMLYAGVGSYLYLGFLFAVTFIYAGFFRKKMASAAVDCQV